MSDYLFKYASGANFAGNIASGTLKFSSVSELNDPTEMLPAWNSKDYRVSLAHVREHGCSEDDLLVWQEQQELMRALAAAHMRVEAPRNSEEAKRMANWPVYEDEQVMRQRLNDFVRDIRKLVGVLSLTTRYDSLPMWAHYANNAKGFLVVYKNLEMAFANNNIPFLFKVWPVEYRDIGGVTFDPRSYRSIFLKKLSDWAYENEYRICVPLLESDRINSAPESRLLPVPREHVVGFFAGWRMEEDEYVKFEDAIKAANNDAVVGRVALDESGRPDFSQIRGFVGS